MAPGAHRRARLAPAARRPCVAVARVVLVIPWTDRVRGPGRFHGEAALGYARGDDERAAPGPPGIDAARSPDGHALRSWLADDRRHGGVERRGACGRAGTRRAGRSERGG